VSASQPGEKARRRAARQEVAAYHEATLTELIAHLRVALGRFDAGEIDAFEVDDLVHRYKRAANELWKCAVSGGHAESRAAILRDMAEQEDLPDWWEMARPRRG
jgi:hypothetical protein